jgi:hypothetical protein
MEVIHSPFKNQNGAAIVSATTLIGPMSMCHSVEVLSRRSGATCEFQEASRTWSPFRYSFSL